MTRQVPKSPTSLTSSESDNWKDIYNTKALIVSSGAEDFDPESMVDEPVLSSSLMNQSSSSSHQNSSVIFTRPQVRLVLSAPIDTEFLEIGGFLHKTLAGDFSFSLTIECLIPFALRLLELSITKEKTQFVKCVLTAGKTQPIELEFPGFLLVSSAIEECAGSKAIVSIRFERVLENLEEK